MEIFDLHMSKDDYPKNISPNIDRHYIAKCSAGFSGADIENCVRSAVLKCARDGMELADTDSFLSCIDDVRRANHFKAKGEGGTDPQPQKEERIVNDMNPYTRDAVRRRCRLTVFVYSVPRCSFLC